MLFQINNQINSTILDIKNKINSQNVHIKGEALLLGVMI